MLEIKLLSYLELLLMLMRLFLCFVFFFFSFSAISLSPLERYTSFLKYENEKKQFENKRIHILKEQLKKRERIRKPTQASQEQRGFLEHEKKQRQFEINRKKAFSTYKKRYKQYHKRQKHILELRLKNLKKIRQQAAIYKKQDPW